MSKVFSKLYNKKKIGTELLSLSDGNLSSEDDWSEITYESDLDPALSEDISPPTSKMGIEKENISRKENYNFMMEKITKHFEETISVVNEEIRNKNIELIYLQNKLEKTESALTRANKYCTQAVLEAEMWEREASYSDNNAYQLQGKLLDTEVRMKKISDKCDKKLAQAISQAYPLSQENNILNDKLEEIKLQHKQLIININNTIKGWRKGEYTQKNALEKIIMLINN